MILARTSLRAFVLHGRLPAPWVDFLRADPICLHPATHTSEIEVSPRSDGLFSMICAWGRRLTGSARALAATLDADMLRLALEDEGSVPHLPACIVRLHGRRLMLVGRAGVHLDPLVVALLARGAAFEGAFLAFLRAEGVAAHLMKPRLHDRQRDALGPPVSLLGSPRLIFHHDQPMSAIDPTFAGAEWRVSKAPIGILAFVERNEGGRAAVAPVRSGDAQSRLMRNVRFPHKPTVHDLARLAGIVADAAIFRVVIGDALTAAALLVERIASHRD